MPWKALSNVRLDGRLLPWREWIGRLEQPSLAVRGAVAGQRGTPEVKALSQLETEGTAGHAVLLAFDPLGQGHDARVADHGDQRRKHPLPPIGGSMYTLHQAHVELQEVRRNREQFCQSRLAGAEVVVGELNLKVTQSGAAPSLLGRRSPLPHGSRASLADRYCTGESPRAT